MYAGHDDRGPVDRVVDEVSWFSRSDRHSLPQMSSFGRGVLFARVARKKKPAACQRASSLPKTNMQMVLLQPTSAGNPYQRITAPFPNASLPPGPSGPSGGTAVAAASTLVLQQTNNAHAYTCMYERGDNSTAHNTKFPKRHLVFVTRDLSKVTSKAEEEEACV